jgi:heptosyltransferase-2
MRTLILKLGATGDVVRTSTLLHRIDGPATWITTSGNRFLLPEVYKGARELRVLDWERRHELAGNAFDVVINLEDDPHVAACLKSITFGRLFGAFLNQQGTMEYTPDSSPWFDMSLISVHGRKRADELKLKNRLSYQELIYRGLGWDFAGDQYLLPDTAPSPLRGDVAIAAETGPVWPMKKWAHYAELKSALEAEGLTVNYLPRRDTLLEHLADVRAHRCLVSGDTLPMHLAIGSGIPGVALFNCTSPWEIYDYGRLTKLTSPLLAEFFYSREFDPRATVAIPFADVFDSTLHALALAPPAAI